MEKALKISVFGTGMETVQVAYCLLSKKVPIKGVIESHAEWIQGDLKSVKY